MEEATGNPPVEYRGGNELAANPVAGWQTQPQGKFADVMKDVSIARQLVAEFIGTFAFIFVAVSTGYWWYPDFVAMGLACGITVGVLVTAFSGLGSGQFNPAITIGMMLGGKLPLIRAMFIIPVQVETVW